MAKTPEQVYGLLNRLWTPALAVARKEAADLQAMIRQEGDDFKLEPWDWWYYAEKMSKARYDLDENELRAVLHTGERSPGSIRRGAPASTA